jgi:hypothetical protein
MRRYISRSWLGVLPCKSARLQDMIREGGDPPDAPRQQASAYLLLSFAHIDRYRSHCTTLHRDRREEQAKLLKHPALTVPRPAPVRWADNASFGCTI